MSKLNLLKIVLVACMAVSVSWPQASAQFGSTYYHMFGIPQANQLNPAFQPRCNGFLAMPLLGPLRFEAESNPINFGDIFQWQGDENKYITFMHPDGDKQKFLDGLNDVNIIRAELASNLISFGWRNENLFFTFDFTERIIEEASFPKDLLEFLVHGNINQSNFNLSDLSNNIKYFHELAIGASYNLDDEMQFGIRAKVLLGGASVITRSSDISLETSPDEWQIKSDIQVDASIPFLENIPVDDEGNLDLDSLGNMDSELIFGFPTEIADLTKPAGRRTIGGINNPGFAVDLGFSYSPLEQLSISASVVDLGFIRWKNYAYNFHQDLDYTFEGIEIRLEDDYSPGEGLLDSLQNDLKVKVSQDPYTTMLTGKVYLGLAYNLTEKVRFGGVFRTRVHNYKFYNQYTISANVQPISMFSATVSYSIYGSSYTNLGLGLSLRAGPFNIYFITDQAPSDYFWPKELTSLNFRLGLNIVWGCRALPKGMKDRPLID